MMSFIKPSANAIAIFVAHGPEVRAFLHSGLIRRLQTHAGVILYCREMHSSVFAGLSNVCVKPMPQGGTHRLLGRVRSFSNRVHHAHFASRSQEAWAHTLPTAHFAKTSQIHRILGQSLLSVRVAAAMEYALAKRWGTHAGWNQILRSDGIGCLLAASYDSPHTVPALQTAHNLGIPSLVVTNSWKDVYTAPHLSVRPNHLIVWSEQAKSDVLRRNPTVLPSTVSLCQTLHLAPFRNPQIRLSRTEFCQRFGLDPARPIVCYSAASPRNVRNEEQIVAALAQSIEDKILPRSPQILLRTNPMEDGSRFHMLFERYEYLHWQKPRWEWNPNADWNCATQDDVEEWVATVAYSEANVSIASTVTMEFAALQKPVFNVCYDLPEPLPSAQSNKRFWDAGFYADAREQGYAVPVGSPQELTDALTRILIQNDPRTPPGLTVQDSVAEVERQVMRLLQ